MVVVVARNGCPFWHPFCLLETIPIDFNGSSSGNCFGTLHREPQNVVILVFSHFKSPSRSTAFKLAWSWSRRCIVVSFQVIPRVSFLFFLFNSVAPRYYLLVLGHTIFSNLWDDVIHSFATCNLTCTCKMFINLPCHVKRIKCTWPELRSCIYEGPKKLRK